MIQALTLATLLLAQGGPSHAALHPADADVFVEIGSVSTLLPALEKAPLVAFLRDERIAPLLQDLGQVPERPFMDMIVEALQSAEPEMKVGSWLPGLGTISMSLKAVPNADPDSPAPPPAMLFVADFGTAEQAGTLTGILVARAKETSAVEGGLPGAQRLSMGGGGDEDLWVATAGTRMVVGTLAASGGDLAARMGGGGASLAGAETFKKQLAGIPAGDGVDVGWFALTRSLTDILREADADADVMEAWGRVPAEFNPLSGARVARMQLRGNRFVTEMFSSEAHAGDREPVKKEWLEPVPTSAMFVFASAFDGTSAAKRMREVLAENGGDASMKAIEEKLGFGPERLLNRLGPGMTVYSGALAGLGLPESRAWIDCDDPAAFTADFIALVTALGETLPGFEAKTRDYKVKQAETDERIAVPITTLSLPPGLIQIPMISLSPSFAAVGNRMIFALSSMDVKTELKRVYSGQGEPIVDGADPLASMGFTIPEGTRTVLVMDWGKLIGGILGTVKAFAGMADPSQMPIDLAKLPPTEMFSEYFKPTFHYSRAVEGGIYRRNEASFGPETWFGVFGAVFLGVRQTQQVMAQPMGQPVGAEIDHGDEGGDSDGH